MKTIIAGGRNYIFSPSDICILNRLLIQQHITEVVSGAAKGADTCGENWAIKHGIPVKQFPANWDKYGKSAGYRRNKQMAEYAEAAILFPGGAGTDSMFELAEKYKLRIFDYRHDHQDDDLTDFL
jgi:predicted Rossmann-fold nucleotide-binding protein